MTGAVPHAPAVGVKETGIRLAAVIGAGSTGGGIAARFAHAGVPVVLLDIAGSDPSRRNAAAELMRRPATQARIGHMPQTGTPLRN